MAVLLLHPKALSGDEARSLLLDLGRRRVQAHRSWLAVCIGMLPISLAAGLLPGPNVFLAWNAYRLYSHYTAYKGASALLSNTHAVSIEVWPSPALSPEDQGDASLASAYALALEEEELVAFVRRWKQLSDNTKS